MTARIDPPCDVAQPADLSVFDPHLLSHCPECGHGTLCSPALCSRRIALRREQLHARLRESVRMLDGASNVYDIAHARSARAGRR
jgi:hypothetical protein